MIKCYPIKYELTDELGQHVGNVETFDEGAASVTISYLCDASIWAKISQAVEKALAGCELVGEGGAA